MKLVYLALLSGVVAAGLAGASNYMYESSSINGVGYKAEEKIIQTYDANYNRIANETKKQSILLGGSKFVEKTSGSGHIILDKTEIEAEKQIGSDCGSGLSVRAWSGISEPFWPDTNRVYKGDNGPWAPEIRWENFLYPYNNTHAIIRYGQWSTGYGPMNYINYTRQAEFEYMPVSYQTGTYDQKWMDKLCVQNYIIGAVMTEMYTHAEHLQKDTEIKTRNYRSKNESVAIWSTDGNGTIIYKIAFQYPPIPCCTGVLEANLNSNIIGVAHIGWLSRDPQADNQLKGRHAEYGRSIEDLVGVFSVEKFIQIWGNSTCGSISVNWLPCT